MGQPQPANGLERRDDFDEEEYADLADEDEAAELDLQQDIGDESVDLSRRWRQRVLQEERIWIRQLLPNRDDKREKGDWSENAFPDSETTSETRDAMQNAETLRSGAGQGGRNSCSGRTWQRQDRRVLRLRQRFRAARRRPKAEGKGDGRRSCETENEGRLPYYD